MIKSDRGALIGVWPCLVLLVEVAEGTVGAISSTLLTADGEKYFHSRLHLTFHCPTLDICKCPAVHLRLNSRPEPRLVLMLSC